jgi:hypothetical protein
LKKNTALGTNYEIEVKSMKCQRRVFTELRNTLIFLIEKDTVENFTFPIVSANKEQGGGEVGEGMGQEIVQLMELPYGEILDMSPFCKEYLSCREKGLERKAKYGSEESS